jgi:hypothetical protein
MNMAKIDVTFCQILRSLSHVLEIEPTSTKWSSVSKYLGETHQDQETYIM